MNDTKLKFTISYDISSTEYAKLVSILGANFVLVPILNNIDIHTYTDAINGGATKYTFAGLFTSKGSSFSNVELISLGQPEWNYGSGVNSGTNTVTYETGYGQYLTDTSAVTLSSNIRFCVYKASVSSGVATPTGDRLTTIDYSDLVNVSCTFTEVE